MILTRLFFLLLILVATLLSFGCEETPTIVETDPPSLPTVLFKGPVTSSTNLEALNTKASVEAVNGLGSFFLIFSGVTPTTEANTFTWTYTSQGFTARLVATSQSEGGYSWKIIYDGTDSQNETFDNWTLLDGTTDSDSKNGTWIIYENNTTTKLLDFVWSTNTQTQTLTGLYRVYDGTTISTQLELTSNTDNTGELKQYDGTVLIYRSAWQANGSGQWWRYDQQGTVTSSGSW